LADINPNLDINKYELDYGKGYVKITEADNSTSQSETPDSESEGN
jgi:hypothetical protein